VFASQRRLPHASRLFSRVYADVHSIALALEVLDTYRAREALTRPADLDLPKRVLAAAASLFHVPAKRLLQRNRRSDVTSARYVAAWVLRRQRWAHTKIAEFLGLDHSTIIHGLRKVTATAHLLLAALKAEQLLDTQFPPDPPARTLRGP
jgi:chromosomal replication initiation ATPase DnaA